MSTEKSDIINMAQFIPHVVRQTKSEFKRENDLGIQDGINTIKLDHSQYIKSQHLSNNEQTCSLLSQFAKIYMQEQHIDDIAPFTYMVHNKNGICHTYFDGNMSVTPAFQTLYNVPVEVLYLPNVPKIMK